MEGHIEVIGIDHGWSNMKSVNSTFVSGVKVITTEPAFFTNVVELDGVYYKVGGRRLEVKDTKVEDENYYILTLAAVAKELEKRGIYNADVLLSVGLPLTKFGLEKQDFMEYLQQRKEVTYRFEQKEYHIRIVRVSVYPQCYAAVSERIKSLPAKVVVADVGSWTVDIMPIQDYTPEEAECVTSQTGLIRCMRAINEQCVRQLGNEISESDMQEYMQKGTSELPQKYVDIMDSELRRFADKVYRDLKENGYNLETIPIIFVGGGATVMKRFSNNGAGSNTRYIENIRANAQGYEYLGRMYLASQRKKTGKG